MSHRQAHRKPRSVRRLTAEIRRIPRNDENSLAYFTQRLADIAHRAHGRLEIVRFNPNGPTDRLVICRAGEARLECGRSVVTNLTVDELKLIAREDSDCPYSMTIYAMIYDAWRFTRCETPIKNFDVALVVNSHKSSFAEEAKMRTKRITTAA